VRKIRNYEAESVKKQSQGEDAIQIHIPLKVASASAFVERSTSSDDLKKKQ